MISNNTDTITLELLQDIYDINEYQHSIVMDNYKNTYRYMATESVEILLEGFSDVIDRIVGFFKILLDKVTNFFKSIFLAIRKSFTSIDKFVKENRDILDKITGINFTLSGYDFTLHEKPNMKELSDIVASYNTDLDRITKIKKAELIKRQIAYMEPDHINTIRGDILGSNGRYSADVFQEEVRKYYRNGCLDPHELTITDTVYQSALNNIGVYKKDLTEAEKYRDEMVVLLNKTIRFFDRDARVVYNKEKKQVISSNHLDENGNNSYKEGGAVDVEYTSDNFKLVSSFLKFKYNQVSVVSSITNVVISERVNAFKDQVKLTTSIINKAISFSKHKDTEEN